MAWGWRRRAGRGDAAETPPIVIATNVVPAAAEEPAPVAAQAPPSVAAPGARPVISVDFTIQRAGIDGETLSAAFAVVIRNSGDATATDVRLHVDLRTAGSAPRLPAATDPIAPIDAPIVTPFALDPGGALEFAATAVLPVARVERLALHGRPLCVPVVALTASYRCDGDGAAALGVDYLIGIERPGNPRLAPFWLDVPPRLHDRIGMRVHGELRKR